MERQSFNAPVTVYITGRRQFRIISDVNGASDFLFDHWATNDSARWMFAMNQCNAATLGRISPEDARAAFISAMRSAGMQINCEISLP
jgi:hypothetical protein